MFEGFELERVDLDEVTLRVRHGGSGAPVLLLHGHPRTHTTWHRVAELLAPRGCNRMIFGAAGDLACGIVKRELVPAARRQPL